MATPFDYRVVFDQTINNVERSTAEIKTALDKVESYNLNIKICDVKRRQVSQIAANMTDAIDFTSTEALNDIGNATKLSFKIEEIVSERCKLERERQAVLDSVIQAIRSLEHHRDIADNLATQVSGEDHWYDLYQDALIAVARWNADIASLQARRDLVGQSI
jgi:hypothetical protein